MATDLRNLPAFLSGDADFRTRGSGIAAQLAAAGLVQASDTGQINWATVTRPGAINTFAGYEIWRFNDTLQATKPVFIKLEYGVGGTLDRPALRATVSTATNGAGTPTGQAGTITGTLTAVASKTASATLPSYCSGSSSRLNLCTNLDAANNTFYTSLFVERTKTGAGADTGDGIITYRSAATGAGGAYQFIPFTGSVPAVQANNPSLDLNAGGTTIIGSDVLLAATVVFYGKGRFASWCSYRIADAGISQLTSLTITHFGASHTFMPLGFLASNNTENLRGTSGYAIAMLWE